MIGAAMLVAAAAPAAWMLGTGQHGGTTSPSTARHPAFSAKWYGAAPYMLPLDSNQLDLPTVMAATAQKTFALSFVLAGGGCTPAWGGAVPVSSDTAVVSIIATVRAAGGDVSISAGGHGGTKLGEVCGSAMATAEAYQQVIGKYSIKALDFDLEEPEIENAAAVANELGAAKILQKNNSDLYISVTIAGNAAGTTAGTPARDGWFGTQLLRQANAIGFTPTNYSIMPFDGGFTGAVSQISALEAFHSLLMGTFGWDGPTAYAHEGVSLMNGHSDTGENFYQADFETVLSYATEHGLSRYTFWSANRDVACPTNNGATSSSCSGVSQSDWDFTRFTARFAGASPPSAAKSTMTVTPGADPTSGAGQTSGAGPTPGATAPGVPVKPTGTTAPGTSKSTTVQPPTAPTTTATATSGTACPAAWSSTIAYLAEARVAYAGHVWTAKWWSYADVPGGAAGVWVESGACQG